MRGQVRAIRVPFDVELLQKYEEVLFRTQGRKWLIFRAKASDQTILHEVAEFCRPYLPDDLDMQKLSPEFCALFFSRVRDELLRSLDDSALFKTSTAGSPERTASETTTAA